MTPDDYAWPDDDLRARLQIAEASVHVLTELIYELVQRTRRQFHVAGWNVTCSAWPHVLETVF